MAKKDMMQRMASGLGSLLQPTTVEPTEPKTEPKPTKRTKERTPTVTPSVIEGMAAVGVIKKTSGAKAKVREHTDSVRNGLQNGYTRATVIAQVEQVDKLKEIAYQNRSTLKDTIAEAFAAYIKAYETKNGKITLK